MHYFLQVEAEESPLKTDFLNPEILPSVISKISKLKREKCRLRELLYSLSL
jgi:hypothetical protein